MSLTSAGARAFQDVYPTAQKHPEMALDGFTRKQINTLKSYLRRIQENIEAEEECVQRHGQRLPKRRTEGVLRS